MSSQRNFARVRFRSRHSAAIALLVFSLPLIAAEMPRTFPLWDGKESVEAYAARVNLPAAKSIDLGSGVRLDVVLIPAGQFIMGSAEPMKPMATATESKWLIGLGGGAGALLLLLVSIQCIRKRKLSFSLRSLLLLSIAGGACIGGVARRPLAAKEAARYAAEMAQYTTIPAIEKPAHSVTLTQPFYMGMYAVTTEQFAALLGDNLLPFRGTQLPLTSISYFDAMDFCAKLNERMQDKTLAVRLPTEAEWEYACRAGTRTHYSSGDAESDLDAVGWYMANSRGTVHPVGQKNANEFGLYDMHGNVWQWCEDRFDYTNYPNSPTHDPKGSANGTQRVLRGGCVVSGARECRSACRNCWFPNLKSFSAGFRIVLAMNP